MPEPEPYRIFISHAWDDNEEYKRLVRVLQEAPSFQWTNTAPNAASVPPETEAGLTRALAEQIQAAQVVVILGGIYSDHSFWIKKETSLAAAMGKPILGVSPWGNERLPDVVRQTASEIVGWNTKAITSAIQRLAQ